MTGQILSVRQVTDRIKSLLEQQFPYVWIQGEVTNLIRPGSGHVYFSLKDGEALLSCVWFRGRQKTQERVDPLTGEVFDEPRPSLASSLRNGQKLICAGQISVYAPRGGYQLLVDVAQDSGEGLLHQAFEELKQSLLAEGLFATERKRQLPFSPSRIALITSPTGAAIQDFLRLADERGLGAQIRLYPALVQGDEAPAQLRNALRRACEDVWPDGDTAQVVVFLRGGGSLQDLWAFNNADLARTIFAAPIPVLTGIGHEIDTSIADLVADARAATPSHAAQLLWPEREWYAQRLDDIELNLTRTLSRTVARCTERLLSLERGLGWLSPERQLLRLAERTETLRDRLARQGETLITRAEERTQRLADALVARSERLIDDPALRLQQLVWRVRTAGNQALERASHSQEYMEARLLRVDPLAPLERGYALVFDEKGLLVRNVATVQPGDKTEIRLHDGSLDTTVNTVRRGTVPS